MTSQEAGAFESHLSEPDAATLVCFLLTPVGHFRCMQIEHGRVDPCDCIPWAGDPGVTPHGNHATLINLRNKLFRFESAGCGWSFIAPLSMCSVDLDEENHDSTKRSIISPCVRATVGDDPCTNIERIVESQNSTTPPTVSVIRNCPKINQSAQRCPFVRTDVVLLSVSSASFRSFPRTL